MGGFIHESLHHLALTEYKNHGKSSFWQSLKSEDFEITATCRVFNSQEIRRQPLRPVWNQLQFDKKKILSEVWLFLKSGENTWKYIFEGVLFQLIVSYRPPSLHNNELLHRFFSINAEQLFLDDLSVVDSASAVASKRLSSDVIQPFLDKLQFQWYDLEFTHYSWLALTKINKNSHWL